MKSVILSMIAIAGLTGAGAALAAEDVATLLKSNNCMLCHQMEGRKAGPGFMDIAKRYKGEAGVAAKLEAKVAKGSSGVWSTMPMPAMSTVKAEDIKAMVNYILSQTK